MILVTTYRLYQIQMYTEEQQYTSRHDTNIWLEGPNARKKAGVKQRPQKFQVQVQTTVLRHSIPQLEESAHSIRLISRFHQYLKLYILSGRTIGEWYTGNDLKMVMD